MPWEELLIEHNLKRNLSRKYGKSTGSEHYSDYVTARLILDNEVWREIKGEEPYLTDHGPDHVSNVLNNVHRLLGDNFVKFKANEQYCLCLSVLFHDVGNLHGREDHQKKITDVYNYIRGNDARFSQERVNVLKICGAHCGYTADGSNDTLREVDENDHLFNESIKTRQIAAILRFADELEEGPHRTSAYMLNHHKIRPRSKIHHEYALIKSVSIDKDLERIAVTYNFNLMKENNELLTDTKFNISKLLEYVYKRIIKLDQERKYTKFYCDYLSPFKIIHIQFNFNYNGHLLPLGLSPIILSDKTIPGDNEITIPERYEEYRIDSIIDKINKETRRRRTS